MFTNLPYQHRYLAVVGVLAILAAALSAQILLRCSPRPQPNVLFITMDSLRHDHLGCAGYERARTPHIDALAKDGVVFREAIAQGTYTRISVPSMVTGKFPFFAGVRTFSRQLDSLHTTLAEALSADGYATVATIQMYSKSFYQGFDEFPIADRTTEKQTQRACQALEDHGDGRFFIWLYYWDPHTPYVPPVEFMKPYEPDYGAFSPGEKTTRGKGAQERLRDHTGHYNGSITTLLSLNLGKITLTPEDREHLINLYDAEIAYVDVEIGKVMAELKKMGQYDNTMIVLNSDHGEAFGEHGKYSHGMTVYDEMIRVPLIIKPPHSRDTGKVVWGQVRNIDIMPTILDYCGLQIPQECNGQSLRPFIESQAVPDLPGITETHGTRNFHLLAFRHQGHKVIYDFIKDKIWLYDLGTDPEESTSLLPESATIEPASERASAPARQKEQQMRRELLDLLSLRQMPDLRLTEKDLGEIDPKTKEQLKALGYVY